MYVDNDLPCYMFLRCVHHIDIDVQLPSTKSTFMQSPTRRIFAHIGSIVVFFMLFIFSLQVIEF